LPNRGIVVDILRHHLQHVGEGHQRNEGRVEALRLRGVRQLTAAQAGIVGKPVGDIENLLRIGRRGRDLRQQGIGIQRDGREKLIELLRIRRPNLRVQLLGQLHDDNTQD
jgi:hypothetical protein